MSRVVGLIVVLLAGAGLPVLAQQESAGPEGGPRGPHRERPDGDTRRALEERWRALTPEQRAEVERRFQRFQSLPSEQREALREHLHRVQQLAGEEPQRVLRHAQRLNALDPYQRQLALRKHEALARRLAERPELHARLEQAAPEDRKELLRRLATEEALDRFAAGLNADERARWETLAPQDRLALMHRREGARRHELEARLFERLSPEQRARLEQLAPEQRRQALDGLRARARILEALPDEERARWDELTDEQRREALHRWRRQGPGRGPGDGPPGRGGRPERDGDAGGEHSHPGPRERDDRGHGEFPPRDDRPAPDHTPPDRLPPDRRRPDWGGEDSRGARPEGRPERAAERRSDRGELPSRRNGAPPGGR